MKTLEMNEMEMIEGGQVDPADVVGIACAATILFGLFGGPVGIATLAVLGPTACIGNMAIIAAS